MQAPYPRPASYLPAGSLIAFGLYLIAMLVQLSLLVPSGRSDDLETLLLGQSLAWGYQAKNPPGFYWLAHAVMAATGPSLPAIYALRLAGVFAMVAGLYALARRLQPDPLLAACAGFSVLATLHFHWYLLFFLTNTTLALALVAPLVLTALRVRDRPSFTAYASFGLIAGLGMLARYNFAVLVVGLVLAAVSLPGWRPLVFSRRALAAVVVAGTLVAPHAVWVATHAPVLAVHASAQLIGDDTYGTRAMEGLTGLAKAIVSILALPLGLMIAACFPGALRPVRPRDAGRAAALSLLGRTVAFGLGIVALAAAAGLSYVRPHHLFFIVLLPVWAICRLDPSGLRRWAAPVFACVVAGLCVVALAALPLETRRDAARCKSCEEFQPVAHYARALDAAGFVPGTIVAMSRRQDFPTAALLAVIPSARMVASDFPLYTPPANLRSGDCLIVWAGGEERPDVWPPGAPVPGVGLPTPADATIGQIGGRLAISGLPTPGLRYVLVKGGLGSCR